MINKYFHSSYFHYTTRWIKSKGMPPVNLCTYRDTPRCCLRQKSRIMYMCSLFLNSVFAMYLSSMRTGFILGHDKCEANTFWRTLAGKWHSLYSCIWNAVLTEFEWNPGVSHKNMGSSSSYIMSIVFTAGSSNKTLHFPSLLISYDTTFLNQKLNLKIWIRHVKDEYYTLDGHSKSRLPNNILI